MIDIRERPRILKMKTLYEIKEERRKLVYWLNSCDDETREAFVQQIKMIDWITDNEAGP